MNGEELKKKWIEALRSGEYKQGKGRLRSHDDKFCCLGVLCDVIDSSKWENGNFGKTWSLKSTSPDIGDSPTEESIRKNYTCDAFCEFFENAKKMQNDLIELNDTNGLSFSAIANVLEEKLVVKRG